MLGYRDELPSDRLRADRGDPALAPPAVRPPRRARRRGPAALQNVSKSTRQRIHQAERGGLRIVRYDAARRRRQRQNPLAYVEFAEPVDKPIDVALDRFHDLALADSRPPRLRARVSRATSSTGRNAPGQAGHLLLLEAVEAVEGGDVVAGLMLYRHGGRLRPRCPATATTPARSTPARSTCCAGARSSSPSASTRGDGPRRRRRCGRAARAEGRRADARPVPCTSARSGPIGSSCPAHTSARLNATRYVAGRVAGGVMARLKRFRSSRRR